MSRTRISALYWGILLIAVGIIVLGVELGLDIDPSDQEWTYILATGSALCLLGYLIGEKQHWWLLFPSAALAAGAIAIWSENREMAENQLGGLVTMIMSIPFLVAVLVDRDKNRWALIPGSILFFIGLLLVFVEGQDEFFGVLVLLFIATAFFLVFIFNRKQRWPLIPAYVLTAISVVILIEDQVLDEIIGAYVMFAIALPFFVVFLANRKNWWALIPAYILSAIGLIVIVSGQREQDWIATLVMFLIAFPFFVVFLRNPENWWALIPAVLTSIGIGIIPVFLGASDEVLERVVSAIILAGIAVTFAAIWSRRKQLDTDWAKFPAVGCGLAALLVLIFSMRIELLWAIALIALGIWIIYRGQKKKLEG
jgi:drug/metabolite transporter (DMT)-like permease